MECLLHRHPRSPMVFDDLLRLPMILRNTSCSTWRSFVPVSADLLFTATHFTKPWVHSAVLRGSSLLPLLPPPLLQPLPRLSTSWTEDWRMVYHFDVYLPRDSTVATALDTLNFDLATVDRFYHFEEYWPHDSTTGLLRVVLIGVFSS